MSRVISNGTAEPKALKWLKDWTFNAAQGINNEAATTTPVAPPDQVNAGALLDSRVVEPREDGAKMGYTALYANYVEFGTRKMSGQFYLRRAIDRHISKMGR